MFGFALLLAIAGITLVYSGFKGIDPRGVVASVFSGDAPNKLPGVPVSGGGVSTASPSAPGYSGAMTQSREGGGCIDNVPLVRYNGVQMHPAAAAGIKAAESLAGVRISIGGSYRTCEYQAQKYKENPKRFAAPGTSYHTRGMAVDLSPISWSNPRVVSAMLKAGWCRSRSDEPWHFSIGGCG